MELKKLFTETFAEYYKSNKPKETHIYLSTIHEVIDDTIKRIDEQRVEHISEHNLDIAQGLEIARREIYFMKNEIYSKQLNNMNK